MRFINIHMLLEIQNKKRKFSLFIFIIFIIAETIKKFEIIIQNVLAKNARDVQKCASQILVNIQNIFLNPQN